MCKSVNEFFGYILSRKDPQSESFFASIRGYIYQFNLYGYYTEEWVINEVYIRARKFDKNGGIIENYYAWCSRTAFNVVRELSRKHQKYTPIDNYDRFPSSQPELSPIEIDNKIELIWRSFNQLSELEQRIISFTEFDSLSVRETCSILALEGTVMKEPALRKAKSRALKKLREIYHSLNQC